MENEEPVINPSFHALQVRAFELWIEDLEHNWPDTDGKDPGPWWFWFRAEMELATS